MFKQIMNAIDKEARWNEAACEDHDIQRASLTAGCFSGYCNVLRLMGHDVDNGNYDDNGCTRIAYLRLNGELLMRNGERQEAFWKMMQ